MVVIPQPKPTLTGYDAFIRYNQRTIMTGIRDIGNPILVPSKVFPNPVTSLERVVAPPIPINFALDFDGINEDVNLGNVLNYEYNQPQAWEFWITPVDTWNAQQIISKMHLVFWKGYEIGLYQDSLRWIIQGAMGAQALVVKRAFSAVGVFSHIVMTYNGNNTAGGMEVYVNSVSGRVVVTNILIIASIITDASLTFASRQAAAGTFFGGGLDCIRNYNRHLAPPDIDHLWAGGAGRYGADPLGDGSCQGSWAFCTGGGNTLFDISGNNYHGTLRNMEPGDWVPGHVPCPTIPAVDQIQWTMPTVPVGSKVRIWLLSYDAHVHKQHVATVDSGVGFWIPDTVRVAGGREVPIASMPGHYLIQADVIDPNGNQSPPSNTIRITIP